jgi:hypothetical protein
MVTSKGKEVQMPKTIEAVKAPTKRDILLASTITITDKGAVNPKKKGSMSYDRYNGYFDALAKASEVDDENPVFTVADAYACGVRGDDIRHDQEHGFITLTPAS